MENLRRDRKDLDSTQAKNKEHFLIAVQVAWQVVDEDVALRRKGSLEQVKRS